jgi:hypothetical protein
MEFKYDITDLIKLTRKSTGNELQLNEHIISAKIVNGKLLIDTRIFSEDEPIIRDIVCLHNRDYLYIDGFTGGKYRAVQLTKDGLTRDHRSSFRFLSIDNINRMEIIKRGVPRDRFLPTYRE